MHSPSGQSLWLASLRITRRAASIARRSLSSLPLVPDAGYLSPPPSDPQVVNMSRCASLQHYARPGSRIPSHSLP